jgi:prophage regulatory protein
MRRSVRVLRIGDVIHKTALSRSRIYRLIADKAFPKPFRLGLRAAGWIEDEIDDWLLDRIAQSRTGTRSGQP